MGLRALRRAAVVQMVLTMFWALAAVGVSDEQKKKSTENPVREIYVPFEHFNVLLESQTRHVFMTRKQYQELTRQAAVAPDKQAPVGASILSANYQAIIESGRAHVVGELQLEVLAGGVQAIPLELSGVGVLSAILDEQPAALAKGESGQPVLVVEGRGRYELILELLIPVVSAVDRQSLNFQLPTPSSTHFSLAVPGDVTIKEGAEVIRRNFDAQDGVTRFDILPPAGQTQLSLSLSNRRLRERSAVVARSVLVDEITEAYERLHATVSLGLLHGAAAEFRFVIPDGFEVTSVATPLLARYVLEDGGPRRILRVTLREPSRETVVVNISAIKAPSQLSEWNFPRLLPLDTVGQVAVVGLLLEDRLSMRSLEHESLLPLDNDVLTAAIPESVFRVDPGAPQVRSIATYYSPQANYRLRASFHKSPALLHVQSDMRLTLTEPRQTMHGRFRLLPEREKLFELRFLVPQGWHVTSVTSASAVSDQRPQFEQNSFDVVRSELGSRVRVRLSKGVPPGEQAEIRFEAVSTPPQWLGNWQRRQTGFPVFSVEGATRRSGVIAIDAQDDFQVRTELLEGLIPVDDGEQARYGLVDVTSDLVYRFEDRAYRLDLQLERIVPKIAARTYSFIKVQPAGLQAHYEVVYDIRQARTRQVSFRLPRTTPRSISVRGLGDVVVKELASREQGDVRIWTALLARSRSESVRLAIDLQERLPVAEPQDLDLPLVAAEGVQYQTAIVAVEGHNDLDIEVSAGTARKVDIGELAGADYVVGRRLLGSYAFLGQPGVVQVDVVRRVGYRLPAAIVERAELVTVVAASGLSQTGARYQLRTKSPFLEIRLPPGAKLWSIMLAGESTKPQREGDSLLISLAGYDRTEFSDLQIVYETPTSRQIGVYGQLVTRPPQLFLRNDNGQTGREVPLANLVWHLEVPTGYRVVGENGSVFSEQFDTRPLAISRWLRGFAGLLTRLHLSQQVDYAFASTAENAPAAGLAQFEMSGDEALPAIESEVPRSSAAVAGVDAPADMLQDGAPRRGGGMGGGGMGGGGMGGFGGGVAGEGDLAEAEIDRSAVKESRDEETLREGPASQGAGREIPENAALGNAIQSQTAVTEAVVVQQTRSNVLRDGKAGTAGYWALQGVASLKIDIQQRDQTNHLTFRSLGERPRLAATLVDGTRLQALGWTVALVIAWIGLLLLRRPRAVRVRYIALVLFASTALPLVTGWTYQLGEACDIAFLIACLLIPFYLLIAISQWLAGVPLRTWRRLRSVAVLFLVSTVSGSVLAQEPAAIDLNNLVPLLEDRRPVELPADAVIVPYQANTGLPGIQAAEKILVPYDRYVNLWNRAYPDRPINPGSRGPTYGLADAHYRVRLLDQDDLLIDGQLVVELFTDQPVSIPLPIAGGVLTKAQLDGLPARLLLAKPVDKPIVQVEQQVPQRPLPPQILTLQAVGKGRKRLDFSMRLRLQQTGGWRSASGWLPAAQANRLQITVPRARTEVRLRGIQDRSVLTTTKPEELIETTLKPGEPLVLQWRPQVAQTVVDESLTAQSTAILDVQEDGLRMTWKTELEFRRSRRSAFSLRVPDGYVVERVKGANVGHWDMREDEKQRSVEVTLLKEVTGKTSLTVILSRREEIGGSDQSEFSVPLVEVVGTALHTGFLQVRRSPLLQVRVVGQEGISRTESEQQLVKTVVQESGAEESPLGIRPFQAYRFATTPYRLRLGVTSLGVQANAEWQAVLRIGERRVDLESKVLFTVRDRPLSAVQISLPSSLSVTGVEAPGEFEWAISGEEPQRQLAVYLASHQRGEFALLVKGTLPREDPVADVPLPRLSVLDVERQGGAFAIQVDPAYNATVAELVNCTSVLEQQVHRWLSPEQRRVTQRVVRFRDGEYSGVVRVARERADVKIFAISNVRVTPRTIEETILLDYQVERAGIRRLTFLLPEYFSAADLRVPLLRQRTVSQVANRPGWVRFQLDLQDEVMGQVQVLIKHDRLLSDDVQTAPIPVVEEGEMTSRFVVLESAGRDEVVVEERDGLDSLTRQQTSRALVSELLQDGIQQAYAVRGDTNDPRLRFRNRPRTAVQTAGALIGKAETRLVMDGSGAYRAQVTFQVNNDTEQYLEVELPLDSDLWTVTVAGDSVKPTRVSSSTGPQHVRVPLVKTAEGDRDYAVVLKYGGKLFLSSHMTSASFPFVHTVNISVEHSQVHLRLPRSHRWMYFGGNAQRVIDEGDYHAVDLKHLTRQMQRVTEALSSKNPYSKIRAMSSFRKLKQEQNQFEQSYQRRYGGSTGLAKELKLNLGTSKQVEQQMEALLDETQQSPVPGNSFRLEERWYQQRNDRSRNIVSELTDNFAPEPVAKSTEKQETPQDVGGFNRRWFLQNKLQRESLDAAKPAVDRLNSGTALRRSKRKGDAQYGRMPRKKPIAGGTASQRSAESVTRKSELQRQQGLRGDAAVQNNQELERYRQQLQADISDQADTDISSREGNANSLNLPVPPAAQMPGAAASADSGQSSAPEQAVVEVAAERTASAGDGFLTSLDVELPLDSHGADYFFSTPRGRIEITATAVDTSFFDRALKLGGLLLLFSLAWVVIKMVRGVVALFQGESASPSPV
ncbi:MAG: hypothetical protein VX346_15020 [Planctomycetota bacterium]|nr:hypothetical protein [Planctomycetota bacterium]